MENNRAHVLRERLNVLTASNSEAFKVLLSHRPDLIDLYAKGKLDLVFSGHAHGGLRQLNEVYDDKNEGGIDMKTSKRKAFSAEGAVAIGPYSHAIQSGDLIYLSGQTPIDPISGKLIEGDVGAQTEQCFKNLFNVLEACGITPDDVIKVNVFLTNMGDFSLMNSVYVNQFSAPYPARTTIGVASLPLGAKVEIEMIAQNNKID